MKEEKQERTRNICAVTREEKDKVMAQILAGKTLQEIQEMDELKEYSKESLEKFYEARGWIFQTMRLMPYERIAEERGILLGRLYQLAHSTKYQGKSIGRMRTEKQAELKTRLQRGESVETLAEELEIDVAIAKEVQEEILIKKGTKEKDVGRKVEGAEEQRISEEEKRKELAYVRMRALQKRYRETKGKEKREERAAKQSEETKEAIEKILDRIGEKVAKIEKSTSRQERGELLQKIYQEEGRLSDFPLTMVQAERLWQMVHRKELESCMSLAGAEAGKWRRMKSQVESQYIKTFQEEAEQAEDIAKLKELSNKLIAMKINNLVAKDRIRSLLTRKISRANETQAIQRLENEIPKEIEEIIEGIAKGNLELEKARQTIEQMTNKKQEAKQAKSRFSLTQEQQIKQIWMQIRRILISQADRFPIENPEVTFQILKGLGEAEDYLNSKAIIENQIARKKFTEAKAFCREHSEGVNAISTLNQIRNAEIADLVLREMETEITKEGAVQFWQILEKGIRMGNVRLEQVVLGKTRDGVKTITLADIWVKEPRQQSR